MTTSDLNASHTTGPSDPVVSPAAPPEPGKAASQEEIESDIEHTRHELGETVEALAEKLDVKAQAKQQFDEAKERTAEQMNDARRRAMAYVDEAKQYLTDEQGKLNRNGWIGLSIVAAAVLTVTVIFVRRSGR